MGELEPPDRFYLQAATGWLELGNATAAGEELDQIQPLLHAHPDVLELRFQVYAAAKEWDAAWRIAQALVRAVPDRVGSWIQAGYSARRATGGSLQAAYNNLLPAAKEHPKDPLVPFNLACYTCQLGQLEAARDWLKIAFSLAHKRSLQTLALAETDLQPLWPEIEKL